MKMDREFNDQVLRILGIEKARELYDYAKSRPISAPALIKEHELQQIEQLLKLKEPVKDISKKVGKTVRTIQRFVSKYIFPKK